MRILILLVVYLLFVHVVGPALKRESVREFAGVSDIPVDTTPFLDAGLRVARDRRKLESWVSVRWPEDRGQNEALIELVARHDLVRECTQMVSDLDSTLAPGEAYALFRWVGETLGALERRWPKELSQERASISALLVATHKSARRIRVDEFLSANREDQRFAQVRDLLGGVKCVRDQ